MTRLFSSKYINFLKNLIYHNTSETTNSWDKTDDYSFSAFNGVLFSMNFRDYELPGFEPMTSEPNTATQSDLRGWALFRDEMLVFAKYLTRQ